MVKYGTYTLDAPPPFQGTWRAIVDRLHYHFQFVRIQLLGCGDCREIIFKPDHDIYVFARCRHHKGFYDGFCPFTSTRYVFDDTKMHATRIPLMPVVVEDATEEPAESWEEKKKERPESLVIPFRGSPEPMSTADHYDMTQTIATVQRAAVRVTIDGTEASAYSQRTTQTIPTDDLKPDTASRPYSPFSDSHAPAAEPLHKDTDAIIDPFPFTPPGGVPDRAKDSSGLLIPLPFPFTVKPPSSEAAWEHTPDITTHGLQAPHPASALQAPGPAANLLQPPTPPPQHLQPAHHPLPLALHTSTQEAAQAAGALGSLRQTLTSLDAQLVAALDNTHTLEAAVEQQAATIAGMAKELEGMRERMQRLREERGRLLEHREMVFEAFGLDDPETWDADE